MGSFIQEFVSLGLATRIDLWSVIFSPQLVFSGASLWKTRVKVRVVLNVTRRFEEYPIHHKNNKIRFVWKNKSREAKRVARPLTDWHVR